MNKRQKQIVLGCILGDSYLQKTGKRNARLRLEHSVKQKEYIFWKYHQLRNYMQDRPKRIIRYNPVFARRYGYYRCQSHSSPYFGKLRRIFYRDSKKNIPAEIQSLLNNTLTLAVWYMDDGYYYRRDKTAYIYLPNYCDEELLLLVETLRENFGLKVKVEKKQSGSNLKFFVKQTRQLLALVKPHIIPSMRYKLGE